MKIFIQFFTLIIFVVLGGISCNAPRTNPLDPLNPDYNYGTIEGVVQTIGFPFTGISNVKVTWENANLIAVTDANGKFRLSNIPIKDGNIVFSKSGYKGDTLNIVWGYSKRYFAQVFFNNIPVLDSVSIYTVVENQFVPPPISTLFVNAWITDHDGDVDSVFVYNEALNLRKPLLFIPEDGAYQTTVTENELNGNNIEGTIGLDLSIVTKDKFQNEFIIGSDRVTRIIKDEVSGLKPSTDSTIADTSQPVIFKWSKFNAGYSFKYMIEVYSYTTFSNPVLIHTKLNISSDSTSYTLPQTLSDGNYYWVIWIIDQFQNRSRSKQTGFRIQ